MRRADRGVKSYTRIVDCGVGWGSVPLTPTLLEGLGLLICKMRILALLIPYELLVPPEM